MRRLLSAHHILGLVLIAVPVSGCRLHQPHRIGVLLPLSGPEDIGHDAVLDWAAEGLNASSGVGGRTVELVHKDSSSGHRRLAAVIHRWAD